MWMKLKMKLKTFYDLLEKEVIAKKYVDQYIDETARSIKEVIDCYT